MCVCVCMYVLKVGLHTSQTIRSESNRTGRDVLRSRESWLCRDSVSKCSVVCVGERDSLRHAHPRTHRGVVMGCVWCRTNQGNKGLISADRRTKPTLVRTIPRYIVKSSTRDLSYPIFSIVLSYDVAPKRILIQVTSGKVNIAAFQHGF